MSAPICVGKGCQKFTFKAGVMGMLEVDILADSAEDAIEQIQSPDFCLEFPEPLRSELSGEVFELVE